MLTEQDFDLAALKDELNNIAQALFDALLAKKFEHMLQTQSDVVKLKIKIKNSATYRAIWDDYMNSRWIARRKGMRDPVYNAELAEKWAVKKLTDKYYKKLMTFEQQYKDRLDQVEREYSDALLNKNDFCEQIKLELKHWNLECENLKKQNKDLQEADALLKVSWSIFILRRR